METEDNEVKRSKLMRILFGKLFMKPRKEPVVIPDEVKAIKQKIKELKHDWLEKLVANLLEKNHKEIFSWNRDEVEVKKLELRLIRIYDDLKVRY